MTLSPDKIRWQQPLSHGVSRAQILAQRHIIKRAVRDYFHDEDFVEIDMPLLVVGTTPDLAIDSFIVEDRYLTTSTEYQIKRMEIGGIDRLYTLTQNFRRGDGGRFRNPEFTMLEWARVGQSLANIEADVEQFTLAAHRALGGDGILIWQGYEIDLSPAWDRMSVIEAVHRYTNITLADFSAVSLASAIEQCGMRVQDEWKDDEHVLFTLLLDHVQKYLGFEKPVFLRDWPNFLTSSAGIHESGAFTERSELFIAGVEISDGFPSLTDANLQHENFMKQLKLRTQSKLLPVALDKKYLSAMEEGLPAGAGMALGFDRLVMVLTNCGDIASVLAFNWDEL